MAYHNRTSSSSLLVIPGPGQRGVGNLYDPRSFDVYPCAVRHSRQKNLTRRMDPTKMPRRAIDLFAGLKLKERVTTNRRRRSVVDAIPGKERKSGSDSSAKKKISEYSKPTSGVLGLNNGYTNGWYQENLREIKISRPVLNGGWEVGDLIVSGEDHPGLTRPPPPTPRSEESLRPASPLLPEPPSTRSMLAGPPSQRSLPSIPPSPTSPFSVHRSLISVRSGSPSPTQFFAGTTPPRTPLPEIPLAVALNLRLSPSSPPKPPSRSLPKEQWPLRDYSLLETTPKTLTARSCPEPLRRSSTTLGSSSPSSIGPEQRKESPKATFSLWPAQELSSKPLNTRAFSNSPKQPLAEPRGAESPYSSPTSLEPEMEPSPWLARPPPGQGPRGEKPLISSPTRPEARTKPSSSLTNPEPEMEPSPWLARPPPRQGPRGEKPLTSSPTCPEGRTEPSSSLTRPSHRRGPHFGEPPTSSTPYPEPRIEPSPWFMSPSSRRGLRGGESLASSLTCPRPGIESTPLPTRSIYCPEEARGGESPTRSNTGSKPRTDPSASLSYRTPCPIPGSELAPVSKQHKKGLPALHEKIEPRDESIISNIPITYHLALASAKDKHMTQMAKGEQELEKLGEKVKLYEDFFLALEAGRSSSLIGGGGGQCEGRGRPKSLEELKQRLESQLRVMKAEEMARGSGWF